MKIKMHSFLFCCLFLVIAGCGGGGGGGADSSNNSATLTDTGGGYTLRATGGTLNDGSGSTGLAVLATLRDSSGNGPGATAGWKLTVSGAGLSSPITVDYDDGSPSSHISWRWKDHVPSTGTYTVQASNGTVTLTYSFTIDASSTIGRPSITRSGNAISWSAVSGAGSYYYKVTDGSGWQVDSGYLGSSTTSFQLPSLSDGSYLVELYAHTKSRIELQSDTSSAPNLPSQDNISVSKYSFVVSGGGSGSYTMSIRGGVLYMGKDGSSTDRYGLVIWSSLLASGGMPPAGDWSISVTGPNIVGSIAFTYPAAKSHYSYWDFSTVPAYGPYTVTATELTSGYTVTDTFVVPNITAQLPVATGISISTVNGGGANVSWNPVTGAGSYYVNAWTCVGGTNTPSGCNGGVYTEVVGGWVATNSSVIPVGTLTPGLVYDVYVTASELDMTTMGTTPPPTPGVQVNMSDNTYSYTAFTAHSEALRAPSPLHSENESDSLKVGKKLLIKENRVN